MITPLLLAQQAKAIYAPVAPGAFDTVLTNGSVTCGVKKVGDITTLTFAGSEDSTDWLHDFAAAPYDHPQLKTIHWGFWQGVNDMFQRLTPHLVGTIALAGHSLGCAHASYIAGLMAVALIPVSVLYLYAPPRMSYSPLAQLLSAWVDDFRAWRNGLDPVPTVPFALPWAPWTPIAQYAPLNVPPVTRTDVFAWHALDLYIKGLTP